MLRLSCFNPLTVNLGAEKLMDVWDFRIIGALLVLLDCRVHRLALEVSLIPTLFTALGLKSQLKPTTRGYSNE